ncbi:TRAM superfamily transporter protein [Emydomyces testavorans]|uniref:TRAM superfamily transporter protein n=1 Tax=Emydomyces testavorans TaxID=2070801 RepID=A0AAF0DDI1_9EURO|nr:TRAM superfamily transporter protein [Emydomyces testavorans]
MAKPARSHSNSVTEVEACVSPLEGGRTIGKDATLREWLLSNQIGRLRLQTFPIQTPSSQSTNAMCLAGVSLTILTMIFAIHNLYPSLRPYTSPLLSLPHYRSANGTYVQGLEDISFMMSLIVAFTAIRAIAIDWILLPIAHQLGLKSKTAVRFAEQGWLLVYYIVFWSYGMYIWVNSKYWMDFRGIWADWPSREIPGYFKLYCVLQLSFWLQQIFVINIEERRKDYYQMLTHHIVTSTLLGAAYVYSFYNVANVVLCIMDIVDFLLPAAKMLKYLNYEQLCTVAFAVFLATWFIARHVIYMMLWWSIHRNVPDALPFGCYSGATGQKLVDVNPNSWEALIYPFQNINGPICMSPRIKWAFLALLLFLQVLSLIWFGMILRVAINVLRTGSAAEDTRSDDEDEESTDRKKSVRRGIPNGQDYYNHADNAWSKSVAVNGSSQSHPVRIRTARGRVTLSDQNDRKALLGRIGCDKPS